MLGEMMFGSVAMSYKGSTLKIHQIRWAQWREGESMGVLIGEWIYRHITVYLLSFHRQDLHAASESWTASDICFLSLAPPPPCLSHSFSLFLVPSIYLCDYLMWRQVSTTANAEQSVYRTDWQQRLWQPQHVSDAPKDGQCGRNIGSWFLSL